MGRIGGIVLANKRMFSVDVTETDAFLEMPLTAQALYFHLGMRGDDDGFVSNPRSIVRVSGCSESDLVTLAKSGYIITFRSGVIVISDWKVNNNLRNDRYKPTTFQDERSMLSETANKRYILNGGNQVDTNGIPSDNQMTPQPNVTQPNVAVVVRLPLLPEFPILAQTQTLQKSSSNTNRSLEDFRRLRWISYRATAVLFPQRYSARPLMKLPRVGTGLGSTSAAS